MTVAYNSNTGEGLYLGPDNTWQKAKTAKSPDGRVAIFNGKDWEQTKSSEVKPDISLMSGVGDMLKTGATSAAGFPVFAYEQARHPINTEKTIISGVGEIPQTVAQKSKETMSSIGDDLQQAYRNPDLWQKFLRGSRAALTFASSPVNVFVGGVVEPTYGKVVSNATGGKISPSEASFLPEAMVGSEGIRSPVKAKERGTTKVLSVNKVSKSAAEKVAKRFAEGEKTGNPSLKEAIQQVKDARNRGKPMTLADVGGEGVKALAGNVSRMPGESRDIATGFLTKRDIGASDRLTADVNKSLSKDSAFQTAKNLADRRSKESAPLFDEAYKGGSMAPLADQFLKSFEEAKKSSDEASADIQKYMKKSHELRKKIEDTRTGRGYTDVGMQQELYASEVKLSQAQKKLETAKSDMTSIIPDLQQSMIDRTFKTPGAVWNPRIARLMKNQNLIKGMNNGLRIERNLADAEGRPFNPYEYAVTGFDKDGNAVVGKVPNMRLLAAAKEGLDDMIFRSDSLRDPLTGRLTKEGRSVDMLRRALLKELDEINPKYKEARQSWAGPTRSMEALQTGQKVFSHSPEELVDELKDMTPSEKEFVRLGAADEIRKRILKTGFSGDEAKAIIKSAWMKEQLKPLFKTETDFNDFVRAVTDERVMKESMSEILRGSPTAKRMAEDDPGYATGMRVAKGGVDLLAGRWWSAMKAIIDVKRDIKFRQDPTLNAAIAKLLFDPNVDFDVMPAYNFSASAKDIDYAKPFPPLTGMVGAEQGQKRDRP